MGLFGGLLGRMAHSSDVLCFVHACPYIVKVGRCRNGVFDCNFTTL